MRGSSIMIMAVIVGLASSGCDRPRPELAGSAAITPGGSKTIVGEPIVTVGDSWDEAVRKLESSGAVPASDLLLRLMWVTEEEINDVGLDVPKLPTRRVWILHNGDAVKLWGNDSFGAGPLKRVSRIQQRPTVMDGPTLRLQDSRMLPLTGDDVQFMRLSMPPGVRYTLDDMRPYLTAEHNINDVWRAFPLVNLHNAGGMFDWLTYKFADGSYLVVGQHGKGSAKLFDVSGKVNETFPFGHW